MVIKRNTAAVLIFATGLAANGAAADPSLAAPGDCAQPSRELVTEPVYPLPAGVAGPVSNHFAPVGVVDDVRSLLPLDLTRVSVDTRVGVAVEPAGLVESAGETLTGGAPGLLGSIADALTGELGGVGGALDASRGGAGPVNDVIDTTTQLSLQIDPRLDPTVNLTLPEFNVNVPSLTP